MPSAELLSPAGDFTTALAAFEAGADAVYCGLGDFSARAFAVNLSPEDLKNLVRVAHARGKKVYVTFNTLVDEADLERAVVRLADLAAAGPDALIVQDLGVARLVRRHFPELALHASTQLVAHNLEGVLQLKELGFTRVVLARELSLDEIASIAKRCGGLELECFIHGALCYSISGLCLFSAMEKGRSGNRGKCAYCCRLAYDVDADCSPRLQKTLPFSMKDLRLGEDVRKLVQAGVASLKIEGRMKSALYVASVTKYYRQILDGDDRCARASRALVGERTHEVASMPGGAGVSGVSRSVTVADLETVFSRRTTELYLSGAPSPSTFNLQPSTFNLQPSTSNLQPSTSSSPIDPTSLGHLGTPVGTVKRVTRDREGRAWVRFHTARALERHDGLQFAAPSGEGRAPARPEGVKPFGFGISEMRTAISRANVFEVAAGTDVEVLLPVDADCSPRLRGHSRADTVAGADSVRPGMTVYCSMSNAVKRMFPEPSFRPSDYPGERALDVTVTIAPTEIVAEAHVGGPAREGTRRTEEARVGGSAREGTRRTVASCADALHADAASVCGSVRASLTGAFAPAKDPTRTHDAVEKAFAKLGGTDYRLGTLTVNDPDGLFAPASLLNDLRRDLVRAAEDARARARQAKIDAALADDPVDADYSPRRNGDTPIFPDADCSPRLRSLRLRAGQPVPAGDWDEIVVAIDKSCTDPFCAFPHAQQTEVLPQMCAGDRRTTDERIRLALPVYTKEPDFNSLRTTVKRLLRAGYAKWEASDLATLRMLRALGVTDITADWTLYAFNSQALAALAALGVTRFVASPENGADNLAFLAESGYPVSILVQQSTPLFISLTEPASRACGNLAVFRRDGLWITTRRTPRTFAAPKGASTRVDLSWDPPAAEGAFAS